MWPTIIKNTLWLTSGQLIGRLLRAAIVIYAARVLGASSWGAFSYALGVAAFLTIFTDIGVNALLTRELARNTGLEKKYIGTALAIKLILIMLVAAGTAIALPYLTNIAEARLLMPILLVVFIADTLRDLGSAISRAIEKMEIEGGLAIFTNFAITTLGFLFLWIQPTSRALAYAYALGSLLGLLGMIAAVRHHIKDAWRHIDLSFVKPILRTAWPFGLLGIMGAAMLNTDIIVIGWLRSATEVGYYAAAQKLILLAYVIPGIFASSVFPATARFALQEQTRAKELVERTSALMLLLAAPLALGGLLLGHIVMPLLFGAAYLPGLTTFYLLLVTLFIVFPSTIIGNALFAYNAERNLVSFVAIAIGTNIFLDLILIPPFGIEGAAIGTIITQLIANALLYRRLQHVANINIVNGLRYYIQKIKGRWE